MNAADAVFEGGGVKGVGLVGALAYCEQEKGYTWKNVAGTSAGAITAALVAGGYTAREIKAELDRLMTLPGPDGALGYEHFKDRPLLDHVWGVGRLLNLVLEKGVYQGKVFENWLRGLLTARGKRTFGDLKDPNEKDPKYQYRLRIIASDLTRHRLLVLPQDIVDYKEFGGDPNRLDIASAVRMSMSIPFFFEPVTLTCRAKAFHLTEADREAATQAGRAPSLSASHRACVIVDGGVLSNFPVDLFDSPPGVIPPWPTFGFRLISPSDGRPPRINGPISRFAALFATMLQAHDQRHMDADAEARTIRILTENIRTTDFDLDKEDSDALYERGQEAARKFFATWKFNDYISRFRQPLPVSLTVARA
jgi:NTE family protein